MKRWCLILACLAILLTSVADAYSSGAPNSRKVCTTLTPGHGTRQDSTSPYKLVLVDYDNQVGLNLVATSQVTFAGFIVQARDANDPEKIIDGEFAESEGTAIKGCLSGAMNTWTHSSGQTKTQVSTIWIAPTHFNGTVIFNATVVQVKQAYWRNIVSKTVYFINGQVVDAKVYASRLPLKLPNNEHQSMLNDEIVNELNYQHCQSKVCIGLGETSDCLSSKTCQALLTGFSNEQNEKQFEIEAKPATGTGKYYSAGFSSDNRMGDDFVVDCLIDSRGRAKVGLSFNVGRSNRIISVRNAIHDQGAQYHDGLLRCKWRLNDTFTANGKLFNFDKEKYFLFFAHGELDSEAKEYHELKTRSSEPVNLAIGGSLQEKDLTFLIRIHGSLMMFTWLFLVSTAMIIARYCKFDWGNTELCGNKVWFILHRTFMLMSVSLMIVAQFAIFYYVGGYRVGLHQILGSVAFTFALLNPLGAFFRPHPDASNRWMFNWLHWFGGTAGHILATAAILVSSQFKILQDSFIFYVFAWILVYVIINVVLQINAKVCDYRESKMKRMNGRLHEMNYLDGRDVALEGGAKEYRYNQTRTRINYVCLFFFLVLAATLVTFMILQLVDKNLYEKVITMIPI